MSFKIISEKQNPLLGRKEYSLEIESDNNPSKKQIIEFLKSDEALTNVKKIKGQFGKNTFFSEIVVYKDKASRENIEKIPRKVRKKLAEEAKKSAEAAKLETKQ